MGKIEDLAANFERHLSVPWQRSVTGAQRVMLLIYDKELERTLRARLGEFEIRTQNAGHEWVRHDCTTAFSQWLAGDEYKEAFFETPKDLSMKIEGEFEDHIVAPLRECLRSANDNTVVALTGVASLYGFAHISEIVRTVEPDIQGRLIVFFPGAKEGSNYRLLDARDGWNYLANSITSHSTGGTT
jgi:hypothetical protein